VTAEGTNVEVVKDFCYLGSVVKEVIGSYYYNWLL